MKPFQFNLSVLLRIREKHEQSALQEYARKLSEYSQKTGAVNALRADLEACCAEFAGHAGESLPAEHFAQYESYRESLEQQYETAVAELTESQNGLQAAWNSYLDARRDREVISRFQDRQRRVHAARERQLEQRELDEMASHMTPGNFGSGGNRPEIWN